jgi:hypothetical protein
LCIISWLAWILVACVVSKKFIKFLRKSLKRFDLNLKRKNGLKMKFEKEKKRKLRRLPFQPRRPSGPSANNRAGPPLLLSFFFFPASADTWAPPVSLSFPFPFFFFPSPPNRTGAAAQSPPRPTVPLPSLLLSTAN